MPTTNTSNQITVTEAYKIALKFTPSFTLSFLGAYEAMRLIVAKLQHEPFPNKMVDLVTYPLLFVSLNLIAAAFPIRLAIKEEERRSTLSFETTIEQTKFTLIAVAWIGLCIELVRSMVSSSHLMPALSCLVAAWIASILSTILAVACHQPSAFTQTQVANDDNTLTAQLLDESRMSCDNSSDELLVDGSIFTPIEFDGVLSEAAGRPQEKFTDAVLAVSQETDAVAAIVSQGGLFSQSTSQASSGTSHLPVANLV
jgi:hypothetical protein